MFQTEIHQFLQRHIPSLLIEANQFITLFGTRYFYILVLAIVIFAIDYKKGMILVMITLWASLLTIFFKEWIAYPRPFMVDSTVQLLDSYMPAMEQIFQGKGAVSFWSLLPQDVVSYYRELGDFSRGFPSGHTSISFAFWLGLAILFKKRWLSWLALVSVLLIPFSRLVLGVHFLGDIIGGYLLGGLVLGAFYYWILQPPTLNKVLAGDFFPWKDRLWLYGFPILILLLCLFFQAKTGKTGGMIIGASLSYLWVHSSTQFPHQDRFIIKVLRVLIALFLYGTTIYLGKKLFTLTGLHGMLIAEVVLSAIQIMVFIGLSIWIYRKAGWWGELKVNAG